MSSDSGSSLYQLTKKMNQRTVDGLALVEYSQSRERNHVSCAAWRSGGTKNYPTRCLKLQYHIKNDVSDPCRIKSAGYFIPYTF